jgi:hypothetical protein
MNPEANYHGGRGGHGASNSSQPGFTSVSPVSSVVASVVLRRVLRTLLVVSAALLVVVPLAAQRGQRGQAPAASPRAAAPVDVTGYWVSVVTEDWRWRMVTPAKGDYDSVPLNANGRRMADTWDPKSDEAAGEQCRSYGAGGLMRVPGRIHITWDNDTTLRVETEAGTQIRLFRFAPPLAGRPAAPGEPTWQGQSAAQWELGGGGIFGGRGRPSGTLKVVTRALRPGYLRRNGVPYSAEAIVTEYYNVLPREDNGDTWLVITTVVTDPTYLTGRFMTSSHFKKLGEGIVWHPSTCSGS